MKRKYRVASSAMVLKIVGSLSPALFDRVIKKMVDQKARKSEVSGFSAGSVPPGLDPRPPPRTIEEGDACVRDL